MQRVRRTHVSFSSAEFGASVHRKAQEQRQTLADVARATGLNKSTLTRVTYGKQPNADTLVALMHWGGWDLRQFTVESVVQV